MKKVYIKDIKNYIDTEIEFSGFIDAVRDKKWVQFVILKDSTGSIQATIEKNDENSNMVELVKTLTKDSVITMKCVVKENENVKLGGIELIPTKIDIDSLAYELPFDYDNQEGVSLDTRLEYKWLDIRHKKNMLIRKVESTFVRYLREFMYINEFTEIHSPKIIASASESGAEVFEINYFDRKAYLAQSPQFYKQMAMAAGLSKVFEVAPCFRAENSNTNRHATEFTSFDVEFSYIQSYEEVMSYEEELLTYALTKIKEELGEEIEEVFGQKIIVPKMPFPRLTVKEIYEKLEEKYNYVVDEAEKTDLTTEAEKLVYKLAMEEYNSEFVFVINFPADKRAFYHMRDKNGILQGYDLIWKGIEITTGAQREHRYDEIVKNAKEKGLADDVKFYLEFFKYGCPPHGGFALGVDRLTMLLLGINSIKETQFIFRGPSRIEP